MEIGDEDLLAYLDERLPAERLVEIEAALRASPDLRWRLQSLLRHHKTGEHSIGAVWRERRLSCPSRDELRLWVFGVLAGEPADYIAFHLQTVQCPYCQANVEDLQRDSEPEEDTQRRRRRVFASSAGHLPRRGNQAETQS